LTLIHLISIPVTNTSVNPACSTGPAVIVGDWAISQLWLFWVAPILGAFLAGIVYRGWAARTNPELLTLRSTGCAWKLRATVDFFGGGSLNKEYFSTGLNRTSGEALVGEEITYKLSSRTSLKEKTVFFPNMSETGEFCLNFDTSAVMALKTWLGWQITFSDRYLSDPVIGAKSNDVLLSTGLRLTFGK
jgi:hypothetical protein